MAYQLLKHRLNSDTTQTLYTGEKSTAVDKLRWYANFYHDTFWRKTDESELSCTLVRRKHTMKLEVVEASDE